MEQFMQRSFCDRTKREQKQVPVQFSDCAHAFCVCVCVCTEDPDDDLKTQGPKPKNYIRYIHDSQTGQATVQQNLLDPN